MKNFHFFDFLGYIFFSRFLGSGSRAPFFRVSWDLGVGIFFCGRKIKIRVGGEFSRQASFRGSNVPIFWQRFFFEIGVMSGMGIISVDITDGRYSL